MALLSKECITSKRMTSSEFHTIRPATEKVQCQALNADVVTQYEQLVVHQLSTFKFKFHQCLNTKW